MLQFRREGINLLIQSLPPSLFMPRRQYAEQLLFRPSPAQDMQIPRLCYSDVALSQKFLRDLNSPGHSQDFRILIKAGC